MGNLKTLFPALGDEAAATNNTTRIQALLDAGGDCELAGSGVVYIDDTLLIGDNTSLIVPRGMTLKLAAGVDKTMIRTAAFNEVGKQVTSLTSSGNVVTAVCEDHGFEVGDYVCINFSSTLGYNGVFRVATVTDVDTFTYKSRVTPGNATASVSTTAATSSYSAGNYIQACKATVGAGLVVRGELDMDEANNDGGSGANLHAVIFSHCANVRIDVPGVIRNASKYAIHVASAYGVTIPEVHFDTHSDGLHLLGPVTGFWAGMLSGNCGDNMLGAGTGDYLAYHSSEGPLESCRVEAMISDDMSVDTARFFGSSLYPIDFEIGDIVAAQSLNAIVNLASDASVLPNGNTWCRSMVFGRIAGFRGNGSALSISSPTVDSVKAKIIAGANVTRVTVGGSAVVKLMDIEEINTISGTMNTAGISVNTGATVRKLIARPNYDQSVNSAGPVRKNGGTIEQCDIVNARVKNNSYVYSDTAGSVGDTRVSFIGGECDGVSRLIDHAQTTGDLSVSLHGGYLKPGTDIARNSSSGSSKLTIRGGGSDFGSLAAPHVTRTGTQTLEVFNEDIKVDVSNLATTAGQRCWNTNAALGTLGAAGIVDCDGTSWHRRTDPTLVYTP